MRLKHAPRPLTHDVSSTVSVRAFAPRHLRSPGFRCNELSGNYVVCRLACDCRISSFENNLVEIHSYNIFFRVSAATSTE